MALSRNEHPRADKLAALAKRYGIAIRDTIDACETWAEEDLHFHLFHGENGEDAKPIERWCAVTLSGKFTYFYPLFDNRKDAEEQTVAYNNDDIFSESPVAIVDLDSDVSPYGKYYPLKRLIPVYDEADTETISLTPAEFGRLIEGLDDRMEYLAEYGGKDGLWKTEEERADLLRPYEVLYRKLQGADA